MTDFITTEFWDAINVSHGAMLEPGTWLSPRLRPEEESERWFRIYFGYVDHIRKLPGIEFVAARDLLKLYENPVGKPIPRPIVAEHMLNQQSFLETKETTLSAAEMLLLLLGMKLQEVEGPIARHETTYHVRDIPRWAFEGAKAEVISFIQTNHRMPSQAWIGSGWLSIPDFAATLAGDDGKSPAVTVRKGNPVKEKYFLMDPMRSFTWAIHPERFSVPHLVELNRLQAWTLKPARLK